MKFTIEGTGRTGGFARGLALVLALLVLVILAVTGCTSDEPNVVGTGLVTDHVDTVLFALGAGDVTRYSALRVEDNPDPSRNYDGRTVDQQEVLYIGEQGGTRSGAIIANFDFSDSTKFPADIFNEENINSVKFSLTKLKYYAGFEDTLNTVPTGRPANLYYQVQELAAPFDPADYTNYPVPPVSGVGPFLNSDFGEPIKSSEPLLRFWDSSDLLRWIANRQKVGIIVTLGSQSDPGLVGFASDELTHFNELDPLFVGTEPAPNFVVKFNDGEPNFLLGPYADTSVFEEVPEPPADVGDGFLLRTGLRNYPALYFDLSALPPHAFINRALLSVANDTTISFGNLGSISVLEWDVERFGDPYRTMEVYDLRDADPISGSERYSFHIVGQRSLDPLNQASIQFDVTQAVLRVINRVYIGTRGFILTGAEDFLPEGLSEVSPDFYYREYRFMGTAAADPEQRPQLKITYSVVDDLDGGEQ